LVAKNRPFCIQGKVPVVTYGTVPGKVCKHKFLFDHKVYISI
jgi:hypothetical protein